MKQIYTVDYRQGNAFSITRSHITASTEKEAKQIVESRGGKIYKIYFGKVGKPGIVG